MPMRLPGVSADENLGVGSRVFRPERELASCQREGGMLDTGQQVIRQLVRGGHLPQLHERRVLVVLILAPVTYAVVKSVSATRTAEYFCG